MKKFGAIIRTSVIYVFPILALILSLYAKETSQAARNALYLCLDVVIPSLFPFFVLSKLVIPYLSGFSCPKFLKIFTEKFFRLPYYTLVIIILGYMSGSPTGAKLTRDMLDDRFLDTQQASRMIGMTNNCSPLFLVGTIGAGLFKSIKIGFLLLLIHWLSGFIAAFLTGRLAVYTTPQTQINRVTYSLKNKTITQDASNTINRRKEASGLLYLVPSSIEEAAILCIKVTGYIVLFAVLSELLTQLGVFSFLAGSAGLIFSQSSKGPLSELFTSFLRGVMEITSGSQSISQLHDAGIHVKLAVISLICGFAGFSVHTQVMGIMKGSGVKYRVFFSAKLLQGIIAGLTTLLVTSMVPMTIETSAMMITPSLNFSGVRLLTIGILLISLGAAPYRKEPGALKRL